MHAGPVTCLCLSDDQLILSGSSLGSITVSGLLSDQRVAELRSSHSIGYILCMLYEAYNYGYLIYEVMRLCFFISFLYIHNNLDDFVFCQEVSFCLVIGYSNIYAKVSPIIIRPTYIGYALIIKYSIYPFTKTHPRL